MLEHCACRGFPLKSKQDAISYWPALVRWLTPYKKTALEASIEAVIIYIKCIWYSNLGKDWEYGNLLTDKI